MVHRAQAGPSISIVTINRNDRDALRRTIESVVAQTTQDFEYIVIDGASTDGSVAVIEEYAGRIDYWVSEPDAGIYSAMNKGAERATGEFILFLNSGDVIYPNTLRAMLAIRSQWWDHDVVYGDIVNSTTAHLDRARDIDHLMVGECFGHQAVMTKAAVQRELRFDVSYRVAADYDMFVRAFKGGFSFYRASMTFGEYDGTGVSNRAYFRTMNEYARSLWKNHRGLGRLRAITAYWWGRRVFIAYLLAIRFLGPTKYSLIREALR